MEILNEVWKPVRGHEGLYEVSNFGRVRSIERIRKGKNNSAVTVSERILKLVKHKTGYIRVKLYKNGKIEHFYVHRLVWEAFNGPIPEGMQCNHINECVWDNRLENLNLMTPKENSNWGTRNARIAKSVLQFTKDGEFVAEYPSTMDAHRQTGVQETNISSCCLSKLKSAGGYIWRYK